MIHLTPDRSVVIRFIGTFEPDTVNYDRYVCILSLSTFPASTGKLYSSLPASIISSCAKCSILSVTPLSHLFYLYILIETYWEYLELHKIPSPVATCSYRLFRDFATVVCGGAAGWFVMAAMDGDPRFETISTSLSAMLAIFSRGTELRRLGVAYVTTAFGASDRPRGRPRAFSFLLGARKVFDRPTRARSGTAVLESPNCT
jgi:hypothetical protein